MKIFIYGATGLGNILMFLPSLRSFENSVNNIELHIGLDKRWYKSKFIRDQFGKDAHFYFIDKSNLFKTILKLRKEKFDYLIPIYSGATWKWTLLFLFIKSRRKIYPPVNIPMLKLLFKSNFDVSNELHYVKRNFLNFKIINKNLSLFSVKDTILNVVEELKTNGSSLDVRKNINITIHAGGNFEFNKHRTWGIEKYKELVNKLVQNYECNIFLLGYGEYEKKVNEHIAASFPNVKIIQNKEIHEYAEIIQNSNIFIGNDSGFMHLASFLGVKIIAIFGPTNPKITGPFYINGGKVIQLDLPCVPCFQEKGYLKCPHHNCMNLLTVNKVFEIVRLSI